MTLVKHALFVAACGLAATSIPAFADDTAAAEALFRDGRALIKAGKLESGCEKLAASEKLESSVGTLLNLGDCREKLGQYASAWGAFRKAESLARRSGSDAKRQAEAKRRADALEGSLSNLVVQVGPSTKALQGIVVRRDGETLDAGAFNTPMPVDPGSHTIVAEAPGYKPFKTEVSIGKGGRRYVVVPSLEPVATTATAPVAPPPAPAPVVIAPPRTGGELIVEHRREPIVVRDTWSATRVASIVVGALGVAALGGGAYYGTHAHDLQSRADAICPMPTCSDPTGLSLNDQAQNSALRANVFFVAGGAAVATATLMWFLGRPAEHTVVAPAVGNGEVGAAFVGRF